MPNNDLYIDKIRGFLKYGNKKQANIFSHIVVIYIIMVYKNYHNINFIVFIYNNGINRSQTYTITSVGDEIKKLYDMKKKVLLHRKKLS